MGNSKFEAFCGCEACPPFSPLSLNEAASDSKGDCLSLLSLIGTHQAHILESGCRGSVTVG